MMSKRKTTMYRQGSGWIVSAWDPQVALYRLSHELPYHVARRACGRDNAKGSRCPDCGEIGERRGHQTCQYPS